MILEVTQELYLITVQSHFTVCAIAGLPLEEITIAETLKSVGYSTAIVGKWHLGIGVNNTYLPTNHGFDYYLVCVCTDIPQSTTFVKFVVVVFI